jgi:hypothetical protein
MDTRARKQTKSKKSKYLVFAMLGLLSLFAYTNHYNANKELKAEQVAALKSKNKPKVSSNQTLHTPFVERWEKTYADADTYLADKGFRKTQYFLEGSVVASNDVNDTFVLPTEETGAGYQKYIQDLGDATVAGIIPASTSAPSAGGGAMGGGGGGGRGRGGNQPQYLAITDGDPSNPNNDNNPSNPLDPNNPLDPSNPDLPGGVGNGGISAVPVPPAIWLLSSALLGFIGLRRK